MMHLKRDGVVVLLDVERAVLEDRVRDLDTRGLVKRPEQSFAELYEERLPLYRKYADISVACGTMDRHGVCSAVKTSIPAFLSHGQL
jgi:shikimate kinase